MILRIRLLAIFLASEFAYVITEGYIDHTRTPHHGAAMFALLVGCVLVALAPWGNRG